MLSAMCGTCVSAGNNENDLLIYYWLLYNILHIFSFVFFFNSLIGILLYNVQGFLGIGCVF